MRKTRVCEVFDSNWFDPSSIITDDEEATDECCVALAFTQAPRADRACPSVWPAQFIHELVEDFAGAAIEEEIVIDSRRGSGRDSAWEIAEVKNLLLNKYC